MALPAALYNVVTREVAADTDVGAGSVGSLAADGFGGGMTGFTGATDPYRSWAVGEIVFVRGTGRFFLILEGTVNARVAALLTTGSVSALVGAAMKYVVYPSTFVNPPSGVFTSIASAITAANTTDTNTNVAFLVLPGTYTENFTLQSGAQLIGMAENDASVSIVGTITVPAGTVTIGFKNINIIPSSAVACVAVTNGAGTVTLLFDRVRMSTTGTSAVTVGASNAMVVTMRDCTVAAGAITMLAASSCTLVMRDCSALVVSSRTTATLTGCTVTTVTTNSGAATLVNSTCTTITTTTGAVVMTNSNATSVTAGSSGGFTGSFARLSSTLAAASWTLVNCEILGATSGATGTCVATFTRFTGIAMTGATMTLRHCQNYTTNVTGASGTLTLIGGLEGGTSIVDTITVTALSSNQTQDISTLALAIASTAWPTQSTDTVFVSSSVAAPTAPAILTLPAANIQPPGRRISVVNTGNDNAVQINPVSGTIDGAATGPLCSPNAILWFVANRATNNWVQN